jgi:hypothetical protein
MDGQVKVADFGVAKAEDRLGHTRVGQRKGKLSYMSPEQFEAANVDARSDVYALGILLYETTVQTRLFRGRSDFETMSLIANSKVTPPGEVRPGFPADLEAIIMRALQKDLGERYQSAQELQSALEDWLHAQERRVGPAELAAYMRGLFPAEEPAKPGAAGASAAPAAASIPAPAAAPKPSAAPAAAPQRSKIKLPAPAPQPARAPANSAPQAEQSFEPGELQSDGDLQADGGWEVEEVAVGDFSNRRSQLLLVVGLIVALGVAGLAANTMLTSEADLATEESRALAEAKALAAEQAAEPVAPPQFVEVSLATEPAGARVVINGRAADLKTPARYNLVANQTNEVVFYHPQYPPRRVLLDGESGAQAEPAKFAAYEKEPAVGTLEIQSDPSGGIVYFNGERIGAAPQVIEDVPAGFDHHVEVRKTGFWSFAGFFEVAPEDRNAFRVSLISKESKPHKDVVDVTYDVLPKNSGISVNGELRGLSRLSVREPRNQLLHLKLAREHHRTEERRVLMYGIGTFTLRTFLDDAERAEGTLKVGVEPEGSTIYINATSYKDDSLELTLAEDVYPVVIETPDGRRFEASVQVDGDVVNSYEIEVVDGELKVRALA